MHAMSHPDAPGARSFQVAVEVGLLGVGTEPISVVRAA